MKGHMFNIDNGYLEGLCRGFKNGILPIVLPNVRAKASLHWQQCGSGLRGWD